MRRATRTSRGARADLRRALGSRFAVAWLVLVGCGPAPTREVSGVARDAKTGAPLAGAVVRAARGAEAEADADGRFTIAMPVGDASHVRAAARGHCPAEERVSVPEMGPASVVLNLYPRLEVPPDQIQVGFGREIAIDARARCDDDVVLTWRQLAGPPLGDRLRVTDGGRSVRFRTHDLAELVPLDDRPSVVPLSRATRADYRLVVEAELGGASERREVRVVAAPTAGGTFQVATGGDVYLNSGRDGEHRWTLREKPDGSAVEMEDVGSRTPHFRPDRFGAYVALDEVSRQEMLLMAGPYNDVPRDCGRDGCHKPEDEGWERTAHAGTFQRGVDGELGPEFGERCWTCHATGVDHGIENGGLHVAARGAQWRGGAPSPGAFEALPRAVRRHGSVWCSACHGPGRILPPNYHWEYGAKFQASVCARCHDVVGDPDANHESWHYREWASSPMARFVGDGGEGDPAHRRECARCHSAQGFVSWLDTGTAAVPDRATSAPITCTSCHDPHDASRPNALRIYDTVPSFDGEPLSGLGAGAICASCHHVDSRDGTLAHAPHAPQANVLLGRGAQLLRNPVPGPHSALADACVACHMAPLAEGDALRGRAGGHTFSIRDLGVNGGEPLLARATCEPCHGTTVPPQAIGGLRDFDGDGGADNIGRDFDRSMARLRGELRVRLRAARAVDTCPTPSTASDWREVDGRLLLVGDAGGLLGDCDGDGTHGAREAPVALDAVSDQVARVIWDYALLEKDGSHGRHNPTFAFALLAEIRDQLR